MADDTSMPLNVESALLDRLASLERSMARLGDQVDHLAERLGPVEESIAADAKNREITEAVRLRLKEAGIDVPDDPITGVGLMPQANRGWWLRSITDAAATTGGGRIIGGILVAILAVTAPELLAVVGPLIGLTPTVSADITLPDQGPPLPAYEGLQDDSPLEPRPNL